MKTKKFEIEIKHTLFGADERITNKYLSWIAAKQAIAKIDNNKKKLFLDLNKKRYKYCTGTCKQTQKKYIEILVRSWNPMGNYLNM